MFRKRTSKRLTVGMLALRRSRPPLKVPPFVSSLARSVDRRFPSTYQDSPFSGYCTTHSAALSMNKSELQKQESKLRFCLGVRSNFEQTSALRHLALAVWRLRKQLVRQVRAGWEVAESDYLRGSVSV